VKVVKEFECSANFDRDLRTWIQSAPKELDMLRNGLLTATVLNCDLVNSIRMENQHIHMARNWVVAVHTGMVKLDLKSQGY
jgi:hypothetical protein